MGVNNMKYNAGDKIVVTKLTSMDGFLGINIKVGDVFVVEDNTDTDGVYININGKPYFMGNTQIEPYNKTPTLKTGYKVKLRDGKIYTVLTNTTTGNIFDLVSKDEYRTSSSFYDKGLKNKKYSESDIMIIYESPLRCCFDETVLDDDIIWERKEAKKMTVEEISKKLGYDVEIIKED